MSLNVREGKNQRARGGKRELSSFPKEKVQSAEINLKILFNVVFHFQYIKNLNLLKFSYGSNTISLVLNLSIRFKVYLNALFKIILHILKIIVIV